MDISGVILTAALSVGALFLITKLMGHKQVAELDFFDYVSGITIGSIGAELATELESPEKPLIALGVWGLVSVLLSLLSHKLPRTRKYINGTPTILINAGKIYRENLKKAKLDLSELMLLCRECGYFDLDEIETAVFEHNGRLSVLPRSECRPMTPADVGLSTRKAKIGVEIIMDGQILGDNLRRAGRDETWLGKKLAAEGYRAEDIFLAVFYDDGDTLRVYPIE